MLDNNLKYCRESLELTQKELGYIFGVSDKTVSGWENSNDIIPLKKLIKFCNMYNYSIDFVCGLTKENNITIMKNKANKKEIGIRLKKFRKSIKYTQKKIADECSISQTTYSNYELGNTLITTLTLYTICKNHSISMDFMCGRK